MAEFFIDLVVFILSLAVLIVIHEFGHFITAKMFKVYVNEFSIGFGPAIFQKKKDGAETKFSIRAVPLGGYCSLVGESLPEFTDEEYKALSDSDKELVDLYKTVPENRRLDGIARWKRAIIMIAGVFLNFVLAFALFIGSNATYKVPTNISNQVDVLESTKDNKYIAYEAGWRDEDVIAKASYTIYLYDESGSLINNDKKELECVDETMNLYRVLNDLGEDKYQPKTDKDRVEFVFTTTEDKVINFELKGVKNPFNELSWEQPSITLLVTEYRHFNFGEVMKYSLYDLGNGSIAIVKGLGMMFTPEGFNNVGGVIQMFQMASTETAKGISNYFFLWGLISVNLAVFNLLPFPGLDGWHFLVLAIEGVTRRDLPKKFKNIMSMIGMILLFGLMIVITFKDLFGLFM